MPPVREINISDIKVLASKAGGYIARSAVKETSFLQHANLKDILSLRSFLAQNIILINKLSSIEIKK
jgi:hypothetical protein